MLTFHKLLSQLVIKISLVNAIAELGIRAEQAMNEGDETLSSQLSLQAVVLSKQARNIRLAELRIRAASGLSDAVEIRLDRIAKDARVAFERLEGTGNALAASNTLVNVFSKVPGVLG